MTSFMVEARAVTKSFGDIRVLDKLDLAVKTGEVACILGPSGSGKSTFLRTINHIEKIDEGLLLVDGQAIGYRISGDKLLELPGREIAKQRAEVGMVFQHFNLFPHMTVLQNIIEAPVGVKGESLQMARDHAFELLKRVGLANRASSYPRELSGGQKQRVAIARALAMRPKLLLFDEPTSALDPELVGEVLEAMRDLARTGMTMVIVTHEIEFARQVADKIFVMDGGRIIESGRPTEVLSAPQQARTKAFLSRVQ